MIVVEKKHFDITILPKANLYVSDFSGKLSELQINLRF